MSLEKFVRLTEYNPYHGAGGKFTSKGNAKMTVRQGHGGPSAGRSGKAWASALEKRYGSAERAPAPPRRARGKVDSGVRSGGTGDYDFTTGVVRSMVAAGGSRAMAQDLVSLYRPSSGGERARRAARLDHNRAANSYANERAKKMAAGGERIQVPQKLDKYVRPMSKADRRGTLEKATYGMNHPERLTPLGVLRGMKKTRKIQADRGKTPLLAQRDFATGRGAIPRSRSLHARAADLFKLSRRAPKGAVRGKKKTEALEHRMLAKDQGAWEQARGRD